MACRHNLRPKCFQPCRAKYHHGRLELSREQRTDNPAERLREWFHAMKLMPMLTFAALIIAVVASVFAIWPVVANAPWEDDAPVVEDRTDEIRCGIDKSEDLTIVPDMVSRCYHVNAQPQKLIEDGPRYPLTAGGVFTVGNDRIESTHALDETWKQR